jgi:DDE family transposase
MSDVGCCCHLSGLPEAERRVLAGAVPRLMEYLAWVPDPRDSRGVRHALSSLLATAIAASLTGATSFAAIGEWAADAQAVVLDRLGVRWDPLEHRHEIPDEATIRDALEAVDAVAFSAAIGGWLNDLLTARQAAERQVEERLEHRPRRRWRRHLAVDGKALRGTRHHPVTRRARHLLAAVDTRHQAVLGQIEVDGKSNELTAFRPLLEPVDLTDAVVTADALHTQRDHASFLVAEKRPTTC